MSNGSSRRRFLKAATIGLGGVIGAAVAAPLVRYVVFPVGRKIVAGSEAAIDVVAASAVKAGAPPLKVAVIADRMRDAWAMGERVVVGSAYLSRDERGEITALSSVCPHLGCAIAYAPEADQFRCPCHNSSFTRSGEKLSGPSKRGLDPLPCKVEDGRVKLQFIRFRADIAEREPA